MSGTASIGSLVSATPPSSIRMAASVTTTQRRWIASPMMRSIMIVLRLILLELGLQGEGVLHRDALASGKPGHDLDIVVVLAAGSHRPGLEAVGITDEHGRRPLDGLKRFLRGDHGRRGAGERHLRGDEGRRLPAVLAVGQ